MNTTNPEEGRQERKKRELREKIIQVAMELFNEQGFNATTMEQIAEAADVARKTLYNYFPIKEAIADAYLRKISVGLANENLEAIQRLPDTYSRLVAALTNSYGWAENNPELTQVVLAYRMKTNYQYPPEASLKTGTQTMVEAILLQGRENGEIRSDFSVELMMMYIDLLRGAVTWGWLKDPDHFNLPESMEKVVDLVLNGARTEKNEGKGERD